MINIKKYSPNIILILIGIILFFLFYDLFLKRNIIEGKKNKKKKTK